MSNSTTKVFEAFRASMLAKTDDWMELLAEDVSLIGPLAQVEGKSAFIEINKPFFSLIQDSKLFQAAKSGDYIITQISTDVMTPSGKVLSLQVSEWYEIKDGLIQSLRVYFDTDEFRKELGM